MTTGATPSVARRRCMGHGAAVRQSARLSDPTPEAIAPMLDYCAERSADLMRALEVIGRDEALAAFTEGVLGDQRGYTPRGSEGQMVTLSGTRHPAALLDALDAKSTRLGLTRSRAVREALRAWVDEG